MSVARLTHRKLGLVQRRAWVGQKSIWLERREEGQDRGERRNSTLNVLETSWTKYAKKDLDVEGRGKG